MQTAYTIKSEWDLGLANTVFATVEDAKEWAKSAYEKAGLGDDYPFEDLWGDRITVEKKILLGYMPPPVKGYKGLAQWQLDLMNNVKGMGQVLGDTVDQLRSNPDVDQRWVSVGTTQLQQGLMALTRAVAKPEFF